MGAVFDFAAKGVRDLLKDCGVDVAEPQRDRSAPYLMPVEDVFAITNRGTVLTGCVERGTVARGDRVEVVGPGEVFTREVAGAETFGRIARFEPGQNVGILLRGVSPDQVQRGCVLAAPGSIAAHRRFTAHVHLLGGTEIGRRAGARTGWQPRFRFHTADVAGTVDLGEGAAAPGTTVQVAVELAEPAALEAGLGFAIREGGRTVGAGAVAALLD